ncbi:uncharacterized protein RCO7_10179 [Rhynchosporium graminicola]|uniref:Uncharacterized protein n=1 Tax=Rhynchosporium graminicola TaxID=2792576 RepID=A0A1E1LKJ6_9HELO|nr:uncharacterized protein RCO7_10179 [Rhynchosporium commune]
MPTERKSPAPQLPAVSTGYDLGRVMSGALGSEHPDTESAGQTQSQRSAADAPGISQLASNQSPNQAASDPTIQGSDPEARDRDDLAIPAPISKSAPSWDPYDATPIAEEDDFQYDSAGAGRGRPKARQSLSNPSALSVPVDENGTKSDRSNSTDAPFFDAPEESEDVGNDWVMVSPGPTAQKQGATTPALKSDQGIEARRQSLSRPTTSTSILDRPRGSFSNTTLSQSPPQLQAELETRRSIDAGLKTTSILNRPRGSFSNDTPPPVSPSKGMNVVSPFASPPSINPAQSAQTVQQAATPPAPVVAISISVPGQREPSPKKNSQTPEKPSSSSSFLPPIRRTSTFGIGFGKRTPKQRFPIEEDGEISPPRVPSQYVDEASRTPSQPTPDASSHHAGDVLAGATAVGAAVAAGLASHENVNVNKNEEEAAKARRRSLVENQRPLSFIETSNRRPSSQGPPGFSAKSEDFGPTVDINTLGIRDVRAPTISDSTNHENSSQIHELATRRDGSLNRGENQRPLSFVQTSNPGRSSQEIRGFSDSGPADDTNTWGERDELPRNVVHPPLSGSSGRGRQPSFPPPGFEADDKPFRDTVNPVQVREKEVFDDEPEHYNQKDDTSSWGVRQEPPRNMVPPPLSGVSAKSRQASLTRPGFAADPEAQGPENAILPLDSRSEGLKQLLTVDTGSWDQQLQSSIPTQVFQAENQASGPIDTKQDVNLTEPAQRSPIRTRDNSREPVTRPLSFQRTPPEKNGHQRKSSLPLSFTGEPEEIVPRARNAPEENSPLGSDSRRDETTARRDPEKDEFHGPEQSAQQLLHYEILSSPSKAIFPPPQSNNILKNPEAQRSQVEWRPNRPKAAPKPVQQPSYTSELYNKEVGPFAARTNSWDAQPPPRGYSGSSSYTQRQDSQLSEKGGWASPKPFEQPPSSAQRYPELFKPGQSQSQVGADITTNQTEADLPAHYYQAPISRSQAFLPRQQTNEYQLPGVGPPEAATINPSRRNSGFLRDIGGRISRTSSRERRASISRDQDRDRMIPDRVLDSRGGEYAESGVMSEDVLEQKKRRASFFGALSRNSFSGQSPPRSRDSVIAHHADSRIDFAGTPQPAPAKRSFFGGTSYTEKRAPKKLVRQSTTGSMMDMPARKKKEKNRFSTLGGFFGKPSPSVSKTQLQTPMAVQQEQQREPYPYSQAMREQDQHQPIGSPQPEQQQDPRTSNKYSTPDKAQARAASQARRDALAKISASVAPPGQKQNETERRRSKSRRPSAAGLLSSFMGRKSHQKNGYSTSDSRSQGTAGSSQPQTLPQPLLCQTYSDLQDPAPPRQEQRQESPFQTDQQEQQHILDQVQAQQREILFQDPSMIDESRGRRVSREPHYDSVPIPGGYSLVRGQGAMPVQSEYDPKGLNQNRTSLQEQRIQQQEINRQYAQTRSVSQTNMDRIQSQQMDPRYAHTRSPSQTHPHDSRLSFSSQRDSVLNQASSPIQQQQLHTPQFPDQQYRQQQGQGGMGMAHPQPQLGALEAYGRYSSGMGMKRISHEDILARSPPKPLLDQQRPYQLSLPGGGMVEEEDDENGTLKQMASMASRNWNQEQSQAQSTSIGTANLNSHSNTRTSRSPQDPIIRLQQPPTLRHPESPAGYPLPEDTVFSPINPSAVSFPPPPLPKDGYPSYQAQNQNIYSQQDQQRLSYDDEDIYGHDGDLDRSNTRRTAVSAVSGVTASIQGSTGSHNPNGAQSGGGTFGGLNVPHPHAYQDQRASRSASASGAGLEGRGLSPSPTPPSPMEGDDGQGRIRKTVVNRASTEDMDLYNASPRDNRRYEDGYPPNTNARSTAQVNSQLYQPGSQEHEHQERQRPDERGMATGKGYTEEKIYYKGGVAGEMGQENGPAELEDHETSMSATSYPGQEWNPYAAGSWDDGVDDIAVGSSYHR